MAAALSLRKHRDPQSFSFEYRHIRLCARRWTTDSGKTNRYSSYLKVNLSKSLVAHHF